MIISILCGVTLPCLKPLSGKCASVRAARSSASDRFGPCRVLEQLLPAHLPWQKGGIHSLTRALATELAADKIRVNTIAPAVVETPLFDPLMTREQLDSFNSFHPLGRNGQPHDIISAVLF